MPSLVIGGTVIPVAVSSPSFSRSDAVDRGRMFDNTYYASQTGGAAREWDFSTPPVTTTDAATYSTVLGRVSAQLCSGDILELPTMCCSEYTGGTPVRTAVGHRVVLNFRLHEVQPSEVILRYAPGDTITGETFTRSTTAYQIGFGGTLGSVAINTKRDAHYIGGVRSILLEDARTNNLLWSNDFNNAVWVKTFCSITTGIAGPDGGTSACTITATAASAHCIQTLAAGSSTARVNSVWLRRRTGTGIVYLRDSLNTGFVDVGTGLSGTWTRFSIASAAGTGRNLDVQIPTNGDAVDAWCAQNEEGTFMSSEIPTTTTALTRGADTYSLPFTATPQEMSVYAKFVEKGTLLVGARVFEIGSAAGGTPRLLMFSSGSSYATLHHNGTSSVTSTLAAAPVIGNTVELGARLYGDGSDDALQSINGAAATTSAQSVANALAPAWAGQLLYLNSIGTTGGGVGFTALRSFKIVGGARPLVEMQSL